MGFSLPAKLTFKTCVLLCSEVLHRKADSTSKKKRKESNSRSWNLAVSQSLKLGDRVRFQHGSAACFGCAELWRGCHKLINCSGQPRVFRIHKPDPLLPRSFVRMVTAALLIQVAPLGRRHHCSETEWKPTSPQSSGKNSHNRLLDRRPVSGTQS